MPSKKEWGERKREKKEKKETREELPRNPNRLRPFRHSTIKRGRGNNWGGSESFMSLLDREKKKTEKKKKEKGKPRQPNLE